MCADFTKPMFTNEDKAREYLESVRWSNGAVCPHCGSTEKITRLNGKSHRPGLHQCNECREPFTVTVGTVYERSHIPLHKWLYATHLMCASKKGISAHQLHRMLGITYKSAWFMAHRIREAMTPNSGGLFGSGGKIVEADETFWGKAEGYKLARKGKTGTRLKMKVLSLVERGGDIRSFHVSRINAKTLAPILREHIAKEAHLMTDEARAYITIGKEFANHSSVNHGQDEYARGIAHVNNLESFFGIFKRGIMGTYHHLSKQHLQRYTKEFDFRYNHRKVTDSERADSALKGISGKRLTYRRIGA
jgi:transposase-like protein